MRDFELAVPHGRLVGREWGEGPAALFLHGLGVDHSIWVAAASELLPAYRVVLFDQRGHGASPWSQGPYTRHEDVLRVLDHLEVDAAHVVGQSMGGEVALDTAISQPARVRSLTLVDSSLGGHAWSEPWRASMRELRETGAALGPRAAALAWARHPLFESSGDHALLERDSGRRWVERDPVLPLTPPASARLGEVGCPALVLVGEHDLPDFKEIARVLGGGLGDVRFEVLPERGHLPMLEAPQATGRRVRRFLDGPG